MRKLRRIRKINERLTGQYLSQLLPEIEIKPQFYLKEKIYHKGILIRNYLFIDYFFILNENRYFVEFNGQSHFKAIKRFGWAQAKEKFKFQKIRDEWLRKWCRENKVILIEIDGRKLKGSKIKIYLRKKIKKYLMENKNEKL